MRKIFVLLITFLSFSLTVNGFSGNVNYCPCKKLYEIYDVDENGFEKGMGFIDCNGKIVIKPKFKEIQPFIDGVSTVIIDKKIIGSKEDGSPKYEITSGIVDLNGRIITLYDTWISVFSEGLALARVKDKYVYLDKSGNVAFQIITRDLPPIDFDNISFESQFKNGFAKLHKKGGGSYLIDRRGNLTPFLEDSREFDENGFEFIADKTGYSVLDKNSSYVLGPKKNPISSYKNILYSQSDTDAQVYEFFNIKGKKLFKIEADYIGSFNEGLATIKKGNKWGFINQRGQLKVPIKFDKAEDFSDGLAAVELKNKTGFINKTGKFIIYPKFNFENNQFDCGLVKVTQSYIDGKVINGYINKIGHWVWKKEIN